MNGGTHVAIANLAYLALGLVTQTQGWSLPVDWSHLAAVSVAGVLADIDCPTSWLGLQVPLLGRLLERNLGRRGWMHTFWAALLVSVPWLGASWSLALAVFVGYTSHLACDGFTWPGLRPWPPFPLPFGVVLFRNGGFWDVVIGMVAIIGSWICLVHRVGSAAARAIEDPLTWGLILLLVALLPGWLLSTTIRRI
ncbi:metal-dependent hydrolase [Gloeobacter morelensis]|uniref:Metal-dependent hydrolase n=1 Tax=Gloeobacter morelensis MG652769 TaxID=2781736 RepID=A0ABY3PNM8_9CYAN|nr:metal-dependent hydrolase [Gloeobacter morelensis]UFP95229.1 metal-dependent hydrolase [Gloeobacter morelensis MG652769]